MVAGKIPQGANRGLGQKAYDQLVEALEDGVLTPSSRLVETELAAWLGMSRTPVREALQRLEADGVLAHTPRNGLSFIRLDQEKVVELYRMREVLEGAAAAFAAQHAATAEIIVLRELCDAEPQLAADPVLGARHNRRFHRTIYRVTHNTYLLRSLNALTTSLALLGNYTRHVAGRAEQVVREHRAIVEAIAARDSVQAEHVARAHIHAAQEARLKDISGVSGGSE